MQEQHSNSGFPIAVNLFVYRHKIAGGGGGWDGIAQSV